MSYWRDGTTSGKRIEMYLYRKPDGTEYFWVAPHDEADVKVAILEIPPKTVTVTKVDRENGVIYMETEK